MIVKIMCDFFIFVPKDIFLVEKMLRSSTSIKVYCRKLDLVSNFGRLELFFFNNNQGVQNIQIFVKNVM